MSHVLTKSKARSIASASEMEIDEPLAMLSDITAHPTFESSIDPSV